MVLYVNCQDLFNIKLLGWAELSNKGIPPLYLVRKMYHYVSNQSLFNLDDNLSKPIKTLSEETLDSDTNSKGFWYIHVVKFAWSLALEGKSRCIIARPNLAGSTAIRWNQVHTIYVSWNNTPLRCKAVCPRVTSTAPRRSWMYCICILMPFRLWFVSFHQRICRV